MTEVVAFHQNQRGEIRVTDVATLSTTGGGKPGQGYPAVLTSTRRGMKSGCLTAHYAKSMNSTLDEPVVIMSGEGQIIATSNAPDKAATLTAGVARKTGVNPPGRRQEDDINLVCITGDITHTLTSEGADASEDGTGRGTPIITNRDALLVDLAVRRLTPLECERLQGFPDHHTTGQSDAQRYRQCGNAVAVPVVEWVARRLVEADRKSQ